ncbi:MAG TPA: hypothetical protein VGP73_19625 [Thermoanaerobaculia bacterium]
MPKLSYAQEIAALEETLAALHASADILPPLALAVGEELAAQIAEIKRLKERQRFYAAEGQVATAALHAVTANGMTVARYIRTCAVLLYGPKSPRLKQFGIRIRRRPSRKAVTPAEVVAETSGAARDAAWTAHAARANVAAVGGEALEGGAEAGRDRGNGAEIGGNAAAVWAEASPGGALAAGGGAVASGDRGDAPESRGNVQAGGANPRPAARAA